VLIQNHRSPADMSTASPAISRFVPRYNRGSDGWRGEIPTDGMKRSRCLIHLRR
jgi:hypothetical protein